MFLTFRYETDNKQILKLCPITVGFQLTQIFKWKVTLTSVMNMEKFCCLCNRSFNSGNIHRRSINSFSWYWLKYRNIEAKYWNLHAIILSNIIIGNTLNLWILFFSHFNFFHSSRVFDLNFSIFKDQVLVYVFWIVDYNFFIWAVTGFRAGRWAKVQKINCENISQYYEWQSENQQLS